MASNCRTIHCRYCAPACTPIQSQDPEQGEMLIRILGGLSLLFVLLQLICPELTATSFRAELEAPADVNLILTLACYPCHSNEKRLSCFDHIVSR